MAPIVVDNNQVTALKTFVSGGGVLCVDGGLRVAATKKARNCLEVTDKVFIFAPNLLNINSDSELISGDIVVT